MADQTEPITPVQAQALAQSFHDIATAVGNYRITQATILTPAQQYQLQNLQSQCLQYSNNFITMNLFAQQADIDATLKIIAQAIAKAKKAIKVLNTADKVLQIMTAVAILGASIATMNPAALASSVQGLVSAIGSGAAPASSGSTPNASSSVVISGD